MTRKIIRERVPRSKEDKIGHLRFDRSRLTDRGRWETHIRDQKAAQRESHDPDSPRGESSQGADTIEALATGDDDDPR